MWNVKRTGVELASERTCRSARRRDLIAWSRDRADHSVRAKGAVDLLRLAEHRLDIFPVHEVVEPGFEVLGSRVAIVDVVAVLPDIDAKDRGGAVHQRVLAVG